MLSRVMMRTIGVTDEDSRTASMTRLPFGWAHLTAIAAVLTLAAILAPEPWYSTDREQYQEIGRALVQRDCSALHCFRILVPGVLEQLPGPSIPKWKAYAVVFNTAAAAAVAGLAVALGLSPRAALIAMWLSGVGFGALFTLFDPYSADPLMFALGPVMTRWLVEGRQRAAGIAGAVFVFAKEFAAAPLWIWSGASLLARRWWEAARVGTIAFAVTILWTVLQAVLMVIFNNTYGGNPSADVFGGGYIAVWFGKLGTSAASSALITEYGPLYLLAPVGLAFAVPELKRIAIASLPALLAFMYVQQPDRALWNFHFIVTPLAALVLTRVPLALTATLIAAFGFANLRLAAQLLFLPAARYALLLSILIACAAVILAWRRRGTGDVAASTIGEGTVGFPAAFRALLAASLAVAVVTGALLADIEMHRRVEARDGLNRQGYRGVVLPAKRADECRIALVGGATVFSPDTEQAKSTGQVLENYLQQRWRWTARKRDFVYTRVANLTQPNDTAARAADALRDYRHLDADIVAIVTGYNDLPGVVLSPGSRSDSPLFRAAGYSPVLPMIVRGLPLAPAAPRVPADISWVRTHMGRSDGDVQPGPCEPQWASYCAAVADAIDYSLSQGQRVLVVTEPYVSRDHYAQQRALAGMLAYRYGTNERVRYRDLGWALNQLDPKFAKDAATLEPYGIEAFADGLVTTLIDMVSLS